MIFALAGRSTLIWWSSADSVLKHKGTQLDSVYTHVKAAFDHSILLAKLQRLGASTSFVYCIRYRIVSVSSTPLREILLASNHKIYQIHAMFHRKVTWNLC